MCGFLVSRNGRGDSRFIRRRGPDQYGAVSRDGFTFEHFLLNVTGPPTPQPFVDGDVLALYNGEIYNLPFARSDGENIVPAYRDRGPTFARMLDGEFAIALYDFALDRALFITDRFATKPIWRNGSECASYESGVGGRKVPANTIEAVCISSGATLWSCNYHRWNWAQTVGDYDACLEAFDDAVRKRYAPRCFIGLSSGYDSGAIACALGGAEFKAYSVIAAEAPDMIRKRAAIVRDVEVIAAFDLESQARHLRDNAEDFRYDIRYDDRQCRDSYKSDYAAKALSHICALAHGEGRKVYLSGTGADEILADYSLIPNQSEFKGQFPDELAPWSNFVGSCMYSYLGKEELVGGSWAIETRYPFLDTAFVQSFLSLKAELKNLNYKAPLFEYLTRRGFPFEANRKIGFCV